MTDAAKLVIYGVLAVVVGLIGLGVSSRFEPLQASRSDDPVAVADDTTTIEPSGTRDAAGSAEFTVSVETMDFGDDVRGREIEISNTGGRPGRFSLSASSDVIVLGSGGELEPGETSVVQVLLDREAIGEGEVEETVTLTWVGGRRSITVFGSQLDDPVVHDPQVSPPQVQVDGDCPGGLTRVSARIRDTSEFTAIVLWSPDGGGTRETEMVHVGNEVYEAEIGPFTETGVREARIVATDALGNEGGASVDITVDACT